MAEPEAITFIVATIPECIEPMDRGDVYEDPLMEKLEEAGVGTVTGGGSLFDPGVGVTSVDLEIELVDVDKGLPLVIQTLESLGAPRGSKLTFSENSGKTTIEFGTAEGVGLVLDGSTLPPEAYSEESQQSCFDQIREALEQSGAGSLHGSRSNETHSTFFIYGPSRSAIKEALQVVVQTQPLCKNSAFVDV